MIRRFLLPALVLLPALAAPQTTATPPDPATVKVAIVSRGHDVRDVLGQLFRQAGVSYVIDPGIRFGLFLSVEGIAFPDALALICEHAKLEAVPETVGGLTVYRVRRPAPKPAVKGPEMRAVPDDPAARALYAKPPTAPVAKAAKLPASVLARRVTTRLQRTDLRRVFAEFARQTGVPIEVAPEVPSYRLDAFLNRTSLGFALRRITTAAGLEYRLTDHGTLRIAPRSGLSAAAPREAS